MSDTSRNARDARFDEAIDRAVREMLDVEPPAGLRGRVLDRLAEPRSPRWSWIWVAAPLAAAAVVVLAVTIPWRRDLPVSAPPSRVAVDHRLPVTSGAAPVQVQPPLVATTAARAPGRSERRIRATAAVEDVVAEPAIAGSLIDALPGPGPLDVARLAAPAPPALRTIGVTPIEIRALEVNALTETSRERREE